MRDGFAELDVSHRLLEDGELGTWSAGLPILADGCLAEYDLAPIRVAVDVDVCDAHCCGGNVYIALLLVGSGGVGMPEYSVLVRLGMFE